MHRVVMGLGGITVAFGIFFWVMAGATTLAGTLSQPVIEPIAVGGGLVLAGTAVYALGFIMGELIVIRQAMGKH